MERINYQEAQKRFEKGERILIVPLNYSPHSDMAVRMMPGDDWSKVIAHLEQSDDFNPMGYKLAMYHEEKGADY